MHWLFIQAAGFPPISYECVFLWIGVTLCLVKVMVKARGVTIVDTIDLSRVLQAR